MNRFSKLNNREKRAFIRHINKNSHDNLIAFVIFFKSGHQLFKFIVRKYMKNADFLRFRTRKKLFWQFVTKSRNWFERANINTNRWKIKTTLYEQTKSHMKLNWIRDLTTYRDEKKQSWRINIWNLHSKMNETLWTFEKVLLSIKKIRCMFWRKDGEWIQIFISTKFWNR